MSNEIEKQDKMTEKALISELTWRSLEMQRAHFPDMPHFVAPHEIPVILRQTNRKQEGKIFVVSFGIIADNEKDLRAFGKLCKARKTNVCSAEGQTEWRWYNSVNILAEWWREARKSGAGRIGAQISANNKRAKSAEGIKLIREDWPKPSTEFSTEELKYRCGLSLNTIKAHLGSRPIAQYNYQAKMKRRARKNGD